MPSPLPTLNRCDSDYLTAPSDGFSTPPYQDCEDDSWEEVDYEPDMARTKQTARRSGDNAEVVDIPNMDPETALKLKDIKEGSMRAELKHIDRRFTEKGQVYYTETMDEEIPEQVNWWPKFALCLVRYMDSSNKYVQKTSLQVNSPHLKDILKNTIKSFPGLSFQTKDITIDAPFRVLFHYRHELEKAGGWLADEPDLASRQEAEEHLNLLMDFIDEQFRETIEACDNLLEQGLISFPHLWTIFRPGMTIYAPVFGQPRAFTLLNYSACCDPPGLSLSLEYVDFDGEDFGNRTTTRLVAAFSGVEKISDLSAYPIEFHPSPDNLKAHLIERGRLWEAHAGMHFRSYKGIALDTSCGISRYNVDGRVVIDTKTFHRLNPNQAFSVSPFKSDEDKRRKRRRIADDDEDGETVDLIPQNNGLELDALSDDQTLLSSALVRGFSFTEKQWLDFFIPMVSPAAWDSHSFSQLVLPPAQKDLVQALVSTHIKHRNGDSSFDDIVKGKGRGLILVLHGPPGVGKTLTAETVAEYTQRPLYSVSSGDLGTDPSTLDTRLSRILDMASTWKAVLLIDEADIFLERRSLHDLARNSLVSIFLRVLEYYEGILFLTSNRVNTFDDAFKSRIHVPLKYNDLTPASRKKIWKNFLGRDGGDEHISEDGYDELAKAEINGRQIKNVIRTSRSLAEFHGNSRVDVPKLVQVIKIQMEFEEELSQASKHEDGKAVNGLTNGH